MPPGIYYTACLLIALGVYIVRIEKSLTSIQKDISYIKKNCLYCKPNPDSDHGHGRTDSNAPERLGSD